ncbi:MAG: hypothetical protein OEZ37_11135, partial [Gemmatimonadota bacterium]|nr:hypothetical protein [Gemmatimonadota bacterium]
MMDERLELLFEEALALPPEERDPFVQASCGGEAALRDELSSLLAAHEAAPDFLDRLASDVLPQAFRTLGSEHV